MTSTLSVPVISLKGLPPAAVFSTLLMRKSDFDTRKAEIIQQLLKASETIGFFSLVDHGITVDEINAQFEISKAYFKLPHEVKGEIPHRLETNDGWEYKV